jgi:hypothetical protein
MSAKIKKWENKIKTAADTYIKIAHEADKWGQMGVSSECSFMENVFRGFDDMLKLIDYQGWVAWYIFDNDCGGARLRARPHADAKMRQIITPRDLAELIVEAKK